ncbi:hypothetical protein AB0M08_16055, partial [Actinoplanes sp. NPDC051851]
APRARPPAIRAAAAWHPPSFGGVIPPALSGPGFTPPAVPPQAWAPQAPMPPAPPSVTMPRTTR